MDWIDVKEQPKRGQHCLVVACRVVQFMAVTWTGDKFVWADGYVYGESSFDEFPSEEATHWRPLPAAPALTAAANVESERDQSPKKENA